MTYLYVLSRQQTAMDKIKYALFAFAMAVPVLLAAERAAQEWYSPEAGPKVLRTLGR